MGNDNVFPKGRFVRKARVAAKLTLGDVQELVGRDQSHLSKIERGRYHPSLETKVDLASHLEGLYLDDILTKNERSLIQRAEELLR